MLEEFGFRGEKGGWGWWGRGFRRDDTVCSKSVVAAHARVERWVSGWGFRIAGCG
jgi:hypothetical protein